MSNYSYDHNTAHILEPVQGYDLVSHMCYWAPLQNVPDVVVATEENGLRSNKYPVHGAVPGLVLHCNPDDGKLETGLLNDSMAQFLCSKQDTEDVLQPFTTKNGRNFIGIGTLSYGGFNTAPYMQDSNNTGRRYGEGVASNAGRVLTPEEDGTATYKVQLQSSQSVFTTFPGACGLELGSSEFADTLADEITPVDYWYDCPLTSPTANPTFTKTNNLTKEGTEAQNKMGGFLKPGKNYLEPICGILSKKPFRNENGTRMIRFWAVYQPALPKATVTEITE